MRIKHMLTLAFAAMVAVAFAVPAVASANWTENGSELTGLQWSEDGAPLNGKDGSMTVSGSLSTNLQAPGPIGGIRCDVSGTVSLDGDSGSGELSALSPTNCKPFGGLVLSCQKVTGATFGEEPSAVSIIESGGVRRISIEGVAAVYNLEGTTLNSEGKPYCSVHKYNEISTLGNLTATPDNSASISSLTVTGSGSWWKADKTSGGTTTYAHSTSPLSVSPAAKYGIIKRTATVAVNGTLGWTSSGGGMSCTVNGNLALEAGSEGKVTALNWSSCTLSGLKKTACGSVVSVTSNSLPWGIVDQGSSIKITKFPLTVDYSTCVDDTVSGEMTATPNNQSAISSTSLSGTLLVNGINRAWSGSLNWTPAGVYGL